MQCNGWARNRRGLRRHIGLLRRATLGLLRRATLWHDGLLWHATRRQHALLWRATLRLQGFVDGRCGASRWEKGLRCRSPRWVDYSFVQYVRRS